MTAATRPEAPYGFSSEFERAVVTLACSRARFYGRIGHELDPSLLGDDRAKLALETARTIYKDIGTGPGSTVIVLQRLHRKAQSGKITFEQVNEVADLFDEAMDAGLPDEEATISEIAPILKKRLNDAGIRLAITAHGQDASLDQAQKKFDHAARVGRQDVSLGIKLGDASFDEIDKLASLERLPTGVGELDAQIGGLQRGGLGIALASSGVGKSMLLSQIAGRAVRSNRVTAVATLELPEAIWLARVKSDILDIPTDVLISGTAIQKADARRAMQSKSIAPLIVKEFDPGVSTVEDIAAWIVLIEEECGREVDLVVVDYGDKMTAKLAPGSRDNSDYNVGKLVFEGLRRYAHAKNKWCWTASQAVRMKDKRQRVDMEHVADSVHKIRVADLVVTLTPRGENDEELLLFVAKHRTGKSRIQVGPMPIEYEYGRAVAKSG